MTAPDTTLTGQAIVTLLALVNPVMCAAIFGKIEAPQPRAKQMRDAAKAVAATLVILVLAAVFGTRILHIFGVSLDAFSVAGGGVLSWIGFGMLRGGASPSPGQTSADSGQPASLSPLILFAASPGTITGVITLAAAHSQLAFPVTAVIAVVVATAVMWLVIVLSIRLSLSSGGFVHDTVTRFMGLIVIAMGIQFALTGLRAFFS